MATKTKSKTKTKRKTATKRKLPLAKDPAIIEMNAKRAGRKTPPAADGESAKDAKVAKIVAALKAAKLTPAEIATKGDCSLKYARRLVHRVIRKAHNVVVERDEKRGNVYSIA